MISPELGINHFFEGSLNIATIFKNLAKIYIYTLDEIFMYLIQFHRK